LHDKYLGGFPDFESFYENFDDVVCEPDLQVMGEDSASVNLLASHNGISSHRNEDFHLMASLNHEFELMSAQKEDYSKLTSQNKFSEVESVDSYLLPCHLEGAQVVTSQTHFSAGSRDSNSLKYVESLEKLKRSTDDDNVFPPMKKLSTFGSNVGHNGVKFNFIRSDAQTQTDATEGHNFLHGHDKSVT
jgi:hypothetical protein